VDLIYTDVLKAFMKVQGNLNRLVDKDGLPIVAM
jgi:hypothetical protein